MDIEAVIAEANTPAPKAEVAAPEQETLAPSEEAQADSQESLETDGKQEDLGKKPDSELTPEQLAKREANRQSHLNRKLAKQRLRDENAQLKARLSELEKAVLPKQPKEPSAPKMDDYDSLDEWVLATAEHLAQAKDKAAQETKAAVNLDTQKVQRLQEMANHEAEFAKKVPDYEKVVYQENAHIMNNMPKHVAEALLDADDASLALYALGKEGTLEDLEDLEGKALDKAIAKAEERGKAYLAPQNKVTNAPAPMSPLKGTGSGSKSIYNMPVDQLLKHFNTR